MSSFQANATLRYRTYDAWKAVRLLVDVDLNVGPAGWSASILVMGLGRAMFLTRPNGSFDTRFLFVQGVSSRLRGRIYVRNERFVCPFALGDGIPGVQTPFGRDSISLMAYGHITLS